MVQNIHLTCTLFLWIVFLYVTLSLRSAVIVGRFISLGKGLDQARAFAFRPFSILNPESPTPTGSSSPYEEEPNTL